MHMPYAWRASCREEKLLEKNISTSYSRSRTCTPAMLLSTPFEAALILRSWIACFGSRSPCSLRGCSNPPHSVCSIYGRLEHLPEKAHLLSLRHLRSIHTISEPSYCMQRSALTSSRTRIRHLRRQQACRWQKASARRRRPAGSVVVLA
jgi:hypothetical protein